MLPATDVELATGFSFGSARMRSTDSAKVAPPWLRPRMPALAQLVSPNLHEIDAVDPACDRAMLDGTPSRYT